MLLRNIAKVWCSLLLVVALGNISPGYAQKLRTDSLHYKSYIKISLLPIVGSIAWAPEFRIGLQFERLIKETKKLTFGVSADYGQGPELGTSTPFIFVFVRPGVRYYFGKNVFRGFYAGAFPLFLGENTSSGNSRYYGGGILAGYQVMIFRKMTLELNASLNALSGTVQHTNEINEPVIEKSSDLVPYGEITIGFPLGKKR